LCPFAGRGNPYRDSDSSPRESTMLLRKRKLRSKRGADGKALLGK